MLPSFRQSAPLLCAPLHLAMNCPLCGEHCRCAEPRAFLAGGPELVDPEAPDHAEDQFAASLETSAAPPPRYNRIVMPEVAPAPPSGEEPQFASASRADFALAAPDPMPDEGMWRKEVANRVESYRAKRGRRRIAGAFSMKFDFEARAAEPAPHQFAAIPAEYSAAAVAPLPDPAVDLRWDGAAEEAAAAPAAQAAAQPEFIPEAATAPRLPDVWNIIPFPGGNIEEFPRGDELAEPVLVTPRILDAPEMVQQAIPTPMAEINLEEEEAAELPAEFEIPMQVVPLPLRVVSGVADAIIVLAATAVFALLVFQVVGTIPMSKALMAAGLVVPCVFWIIYQYMFLVHRGRTPGMLLARLSLAGFEGEPVARGLRRWRALALALSSVSLGLGFVWALVDEDALCWHDRITRTYLVQVDE